VVTKQLSKHRAHNATAKQRAGIYMQARPGKVFLSFTAPPPHTKTKRAPPLRAVGYFAIAIYAKSRRRRRAAELLFWRALHGS